MILKIENPCEVSIDQMNSIPEGKFCEICSKKVLDLSQLQASEIKNALQRNKDRGFCGILTKNQLNRSLGSEIPFYRLPPLKRKTTFTKIAAGIVLTAGIAGSYPAQVQKNTNPEISVAAHHLTKQKSKPADTDNGNTTIKGKVVDKKTGKPIPNVAVKLITFKKIYTAATNNHGFYSLEIPGIAIKEENLLEFNPAADGFNTELVILKKDEITKENRTGLSENAIYREYGEISEALPYSNSLVMVDGKKIDARIFNKSYMLFPHRYEVYYIPKPFTRIFTDHKSIEDIFIAFIR